MTDDEASFEEAKKAFQDAIAAYNGGNAIAAESYLRRMGLFLQAMQSDDFRSSLKLCIT